MVVVFVVVDSFLNIFSFRLIEFNKVSWLPLSDRSARLMKGADELLSTR